MTLMIRRRRAVILVALSLLIFHATAAVAATSWRELLDQAEKLSAEGKRDESVRAAQDAQADAKKSLGPEAPEIGRVLARLSRIYEDAAADTQLPELERLLSAMKSKDFEAWFALGRILHEEGKSFEAGDALTKALALKPDDPEAERELARAYCDMGRFDAAIILLQKLIGQEPENYIHYSMLANAYSTLGRPTEAREMYARAKKIGGKLLDVYIEEGYFYLQSGDSVHAREDFESIIAIDTSSSLGYHHMGAYLYSRRQYPEAERNFRQALEKLRANPNASKQDFLHTKLWLGDTIAAQGRYAEAETVYLDALEKSWPGDGRRPMLLEKLAALYAAEGKNAQAEEFYRRAVTAFRTRFELRFEYVVSALIDLGNFYLSRGRKTEAEDMAEQAEKFCEDIPIGRGRFNRLREVSLFYASLGQASKNEALYARLLPMRRTRPFDPDLVWVEGGLAAIDAARGRLREAEDLDRRAIEVLDHNTRWKEEADFLDNLAGLYEKEGTPRRAAEEARAQAKSLRARP